MRKKPQAAPAPQPAAESSKTPAKVVRDTKILAGALEGKSNSAIAREIGIDRETVARVLKSDDIKRLTEEIDFELSLGIKKAIKCVLRGVREDSGLAIKLLQNFGSMRSRLEVTGKDGAPLAGLTDEQLENRLGLLLEKLGKGGK